MIVTEGEITKVYCIYLNMFSVPNRKFFLNLKIEIGISNFVSFLTKRYSRLVLDIVTQEFDKIYNISDRVHSTFLQTFHGGLHTKNLVDHCSFYKIYVRYQVLSFSTEYTLNKFVF